jgi:glutamate---cysteine ligase / carboxylate-amine ligase
MPLHSEPFTIGVEEEYQIIDPRTRELSQSSEQILPIAAQTLGDAVQLEMFLSQIEIATPICATLADVESQLSRMRGGMIDAAAQVGKQIGSAGTHPFSAWQEQLATPGERYQMLIENYRYFIRQQLIYGCHVHVGIHDRKLAVLAQNHARPWLPVLLALSASSPLWMGEDTGYSSFRTGLWWTSPLSGPPPIFSSRAEYDALIQTLVESRCVEDSMSIYWDIRLSGRFPTVEFRVMDVCMTVDEAVMIAGLVRALVRTGYELALNDVPPRPTRVESIRTANWHAARYGLEGDLIDLQAERSVPARELVEKFLEFLRPALQAAGDWGRIATSVYHSLDHGNGATRQRAVFRRTGNAKDVVDYIVAETAKGVR